MDKFDGVIVACSRKKGGYCVVVWNKKLDHNGFRRLVWTPTSGPFGDELPKYTIERDNYVLDVGDVVTVYPSLRYYPPLPIQPENVHVWQESRFNGFHKRKDAVRFSNDYIVNFILHPLPQADECLFGMESPSCKVTPEEATHIGNSFTMAQIDDLRFVEDTPSREGAESRVLAFFKYKGQQYSYVRVTIGKKAEDIARFAGKTYKHAFVAFSLTQPYEFDQMCYVCLCAFYGGEEEENE